MSQFAFGAGNLYVTQLQDANGNSISNPTPYPLLVLQEGSIDLSSDTKELYGQNQFPVAVGRGKSKIQIKVKPARIIAAVWNAIYFGQTLSSGLIANFTDTTGSVIPGTPYQVTITPPTSGTFAADLGVIDGATGRPLLRVASAPATGQYSVNVGTGVYTFAAADTAKTMYINYQYTTSSATTGQKMTVANLSMGYVPTFRTDLTVSYLGKITTFQFPLCVSTKFAFPLKNEDFTMPEFEFSAFDNGSGTVMSWATSE
jgi:hypothetical protein